MRKIYILCLLSILFGGNLFAKDFWERVNVPNDTYVRDIAFLNNGDLIAGGFGLFRSTDLGTSWIDEAIIDLDGLQIPASSVPLAVTTVYPVNDTVILVCAFGKILKSTDGGKLFKLVDTELNYVYSFIKTANGRIFANQYYNLYYSDDLGDTWVRYEGMELNEDTFPNNKMRMALSPDGKLFVSNKGVWIIDTESLNGNYYDLAGDSLNVRCFLFNNGKVYAGTDTNGIYVSNDNGKSWSNLPYAFEFFPVTVMAVSPSGRILAGSEGLDYFLDEKIGGLFYSDDEGNSWERIIGEIPDIEIYDIEIRNDEIYIASTGIYKSINNGQNWSRTLANPGYPLVKFIGMNSKSEYIMLNEHNINSSNNNFQSWDNIYNNIYNNIINRTVITDDDRILNMNTGNDHKLMVSTNNGITFTEAVLPPEVDFKSLIYKTVNGYIYLTYYDVQHRFKVLVSKNNGDSWEKINSANDLVFFGTEKNNNLLTINFKDSLLISEDFGDTWINKPFPKFDDINGNNISSSDMSGDYIYLGTYRDGIIKSTDGGNTWAYNNSGLNSILNLNEQVRVNQINILNERVYASTDIGLFSSNLADTVWTLQDSGMAASNTLFTTYLKDKHIYVSTYTGLYRSTDEVVSVDENIEIDGINISVHPNPVVISGTINIECQNNSGLKLNLYDISGNLVENIYDNTVSSGNTVLQFNPAKLCSGQYYLRAETANSSRTKIISVVK